MRNLKPGHIAEAAFWLALAGFFYVKSFGFDREIEIYRFGAAAWPRALLLLIALAAVGQLVRHWLFPRRRTIAVCPAGLERRRRAALAPGRIFLLALPLAYLVVPDWAQARSGWTGRHCIRSNLPRPRRCFFPTSRSCATIRSA